MSFPRYEAYKDSGIEWLQDVPKHWAIRPFWTLFRRTKRTGYSSEALLSVYRDYGVVLKSSRDDNFNKASEDLDLYQLVEVGDLAINKMKAWQGSVGVSELRGIVSPAYFVYKPIHCESSRYLHYLLRSAQYTAAYISISKGIRVNQWDMDPQYHSRLPVLVPPLAEQMASTALLDRETAKIDALVEEQQRLIALLKEKRQAVISHAVTKGLDPNTLMKDSGVEWLGEVPAHWRVAKLSYLTRQIVDGTHFTPTYVEEGIPFLRVTDITRAKIDLAEVKRIPMSEHQTLSTRCKPQKGDLLLSKNGTIGVPKVVTWDWDFSIFVSLCLIKFSSWILADYAKYVFESSSIESQINEGSKQSTVTNLHLEKIAAFRFPVPSPTEQSEIVSRLDNATSELNKLIETAEFAVALLQERRSALISAVVTGKIDVRGLAPAEARAA